MAVTGPGSTQLDWRTLLTTSTCHRDVQRFIDTTFQAADAKQRITAMATHLADSVLLAATATIPVRVP